MGTPKKCIIDNWSLEHAGLLLDDSNDISQKSNDSIINNLGGLSNFINALLLYKDSHFIMNGFEKDWKRFEWFDKNASAFIKGIELDELTINWNGPSAYENKGIHNYLFTSRYFESDLLVCPERSDEKMLGDLTIDNSFAETLRLIDKKIAHEIDALNFRNTKIGISENFQFPSLLQYILSQASGRHDLLTVIMQLKSDGKIEKIVKEIEEITTTAKGAGKFQDDIERLVKKYFGKQTTGDNSWSISVSAFLRLLI
ncbi:MAG: hypothetical protein QY309_18685 [Cyclobacteriaceae bacterium]|nr:MAG: hypothetical protein QY309_18685 [Cyclobacteriaceae bacterium]